MTALKPALVALVIMVPAVFAAIGQWRQGVLTWPDIAVGAMIFVTVPLVLWLFTRQQEVARRNFAARQDVEENDAEPGGTPAA